MTIPALHEPGLVGIRSQRQPVVEQFSRLCPRGPYVFPLEVGVTLAAREQLDWAALYVVSRQQRRHHTWWQRATAEMRRASYCDWLLMPRETACELPRFGLGDGFRAAYPALRQRLRAERSRPVCNEGLAQLETNNAGLPVAGGAMAWTVRRALLGILFSFPRRIGRSGGFLLLGV